MDKPELDDEGIDFTDIPEVTDASGWKPISDYNGSLNSLLHAYHEDAKVGLNGSDQRTGLNKTADFVSPMKQQLLKNMNSWQKDSPDFVKCPKCQGYGIQISKRRRQHTQCSQCRGTGWKYRPKEETSPL